MEIKQQGYSIAFIRVAIIIIGFIGLSFNNKTNNYNYNVNTNISHITEKYPYIITLKENLIILNAKLNIIQYIKSTNRDNAEKYISAIENIGVIKLTENEFDFNGSVAAFVKYKTKDDIIIFKKDAEGEDSFLNTIHHELIHKLESVGFFDEVNDDLLTDLFKFNESDRYTKGKSNLGILLGEDIFKIDDDIIDIFYQDSLFREIEYYTSPSETLARLLNLKLYLYHNNIINTFQEDITMDHIIYAFIESLVTTQCMCHDFQYTIILLDLIDSKTIDNINLILK